MNSVSPSVLPEMIRAPPGQQRTLERLLAIDVVLVKLEHKQPEVRGLSSSAISLGAAKDAAQLLSVSLASVKRRRAFASVFLYDELAD